MITTFFSPNWRIKFHDFIFLHDGLGKSGKINRTNEKEWKTKIQKIASFNNKGFKTNSKRQCVWVCVCKGEREGEIGILEWTCLVQNFWRYPQKTFLFIGFQGLKVLSGRSLKLPLDRFTLADYCFTQRERERERVNERVREREMKFLSRLMIRALPLISVTRCRNKK